MTWLAATLANQNRYAESEELFRQAWDRQCRTMGNEHSCTLKTLSSIAMVLESQEKNQEAEQLYRQLLEINRNLHGLEHAATGTVLIQLGQNLCRQMLDGDLNEPVDAETCFLFALAHADVGEKREAVPWQTRGDSTVNAEESDKTWLTDLSNYVSKVIQNGKQETQTENGEQE